MNIKTMLLCHWNKVFSLDHDALAKSETWFILRYHIQTIMVINFVFLAGSTFLFWP